MSEQITTFLGVSGLLFLLFSVATTQCDCLLPAYIFILIHFLAITTAFPFLVRGLYLEDLIHLDFLLLVSLLSIFNGLGFIILSMIITDLSSWFVVLAIVEFLPILMVMIRLPFIEVGERQVPGMVA